MLLQEHLAAALKRTPAMKARTGNDEKKERNEKKENKEKESPLDPLPPLGVPGRQLRHRSPSGIQRAAAETKGGEVAGACHAGCVGSIASRQA